MKGKKILSFLLVFTMLVGTLSNAAFAAGDGSFTQEPNAPEAYADYDFFDDFGDAEDGVINGDVWHHQVPTSTVMNRKKDPESTDAQNGKGYCFYTDGATKSFIEHKFDTTIRGKVSVDFYDDGVNQVGRMAQVNLTGVANTQNADKPFTIGLGINQNTATQGSSNTNYCARIADDGRFIDTGVERTKGWHTFTIECTAEGTNLWIDGKAIDTSAIPEKDVVTAFQNIHMGDKWAKGGQTYFDNVRLENMTVVDLEAEEAAKHDATLKAIKVDGVAVPDFAADKADYTWQIPVGAELPVVSAETTNEKATAEIVQATAETKKAVITVTAVDGVATKTYSVTFEETAEVEKEWTATFDEEDPKALWEQLDERGLYFETTDEQAHDGTKSFVTRGTADKKSWIFKHFTQPVTGKVSVWFYDTMGKMGKETFQQVNIWGPFEDVATQPVIAGLGTSRGSATYVVRDGKGYYPATSVTRTEGWHEFVFDLTSGSDAKFYIDGTLVHTTDVVTAIGALQMGDIWSTTGATAYYDDIKITDIQAAVNGVRLNKEEASIPCGETLQLKATVLPVGTTSDITWSTDNEAVATVDENGLVTAGGVVGTATITATTAKGGYTATCKITATKTTLQDTSLKNIKVDGKDINGFAIDKVEYEMTVANGKVPTVTAEATQADATVKVTPATKVPGVTTIEVTAPDGVNKQVYTINFKGLENIFFDDFSYTDTEDLEKRGNWDVQEGTGRRPGNRTWWWSKDNVVLTEDKDDPDNTIVRLKAKTDGTGGENVSQSQIRYYEEKFGAGIYVAKVWLYDNVMEVGTDDAPGTGAWNAKDQALSTFFTINRIEAPTWKPYHESDFEYLFNGGWGMGPKTMWFTSWNSYSLGSSTEAQKNQSSSTGPSLVGSLDGKWSILTIKLDEDGRTTYYIDGVERASHANKDEIAGPQSIAFNLWFINGGQNTNIKGSRTYWEDIDWVYYTPDTTVTTAEVEGIVADMKEADMKVFDDIAAPDITMKSITVDGKALTGFADDKTEYTVALPAGTTEAPVVEAKANNQFSIVTVTPANELPGATTVLVQSSDLSVTRTYHINFTVEGNTAVPAPLSNIASGSAVKYRDVKLFHTNENAVIYYTKDGSTPTTASTKYNGETFRIEESTNIKAIAVVDGKTSPVADFLYTVIPLTPQVVMHPDVAINGKSIMKGNVIDTTKLTYDGSATIELTMPESKQRFYEVPGRTDNYKFYYTTDGTLPTTNQYSPNPSTKLYTGPIKVTKNTVINFTAVLPGVCESYEDTVALRNQYSCINVKVNPIPDADYTITTAKMTGGTVVADKATAKAGETVTLTVTPDEGYTLKKGSLKANDKVITGNTFVMPTEDVVISAVFTKDEIATDGKLKLQINRTPKNVVTLTWTAQEGAIGYNVYDTPNDGQMTLCNTELVTECTYTLEGLDLNKVHALTVKAVREGGEEFGTENVRKVGITENIDVKTQGIKTLIDRKNYLKLPVGDLAQSIEYLGPTIQDDQYHYWCYSSVRDENGLYHVFMSRVPRDITFAPGWKTSSEIVHFVGEGPEGPFTEVGTPFAPTTLPDGQQSAHNPRIKYIDGKYVLLYIVRYNYVDNKNQGSQKTCMAIIDELPTEAGSDTIDKWDLVNDNGVVLEYGIKAVNPDMFKVEGKTDAEDEYVLLFKGNADKDVERAPYYLFYATSNKLEGPYTFQGKYTDATTTIEDPSVFEWKDKYFMLTYDLGNGISGAGQSVGMMIPSRDPHFFSFKDAQITSGMLNDYVKLPAGFTGSYSGTVRIERPYIVFENGKPTYFTGTNSVDVNGNSVAQSYTFKINDLPKHAVKVDTAMTGGTIKILNNVKEAEQFDDVYFEVVPDKGNVLVADSIKITATDAMGRACTPKVETVNGKLCFIMPAGEATITAKFTTGEAIVIDSVTVTPETVKVLPGATQEFKAEVKGNTSALGTVTWTVEGAASADTVISKDGVLTVATNETADELTVKAVSTEDTTKFDTAVVTVAKNLALGLEDEFYLASSYHKNAPGTVICHPTNAFDGEYRTDLNGIWTPKAGDTDPWIGVNFGKETTFDTLKITELYNAGAFLNGLTVQVSNDGETWTDVQKFTIEKTDSKDARTTELKLDKPATGKYMRIAHLTSELPVSGNPTFTHLMELEVFNLGTPAVTKHKITVETVEGGKLIVDKTTAKKGEWVKVTAQPDAGYKFVMGSLKVNGKTSSLHFQMPDEDIVITAEFEKLPVEHTHTWKSPVWTWNGYKATVKFVCEADASHVATPEVTVTDKVTKEATCTQEGVRTYTASVTFEGKTYTDTKAEVLPKAPHHLEDGICTECGEDFNNYGGNGGSDKEHKHDGSNGAWVSDTKEHWHVCECGDIIDKEAHTVGADGACTVCHKVLGAPSNGGNGSAQSPNTGDTMNALPLVALLGAVLAAAAVVLKRRKAVK